MPRPRKPCRCGSIEYNLNCPDCQTRRLKRKLADSRINAGLCPRCGKPRAPGRIHCEGCLEKAVRTLEKTRPPKNILPQALRETIRKARRKLL